MDWDKDQQEAITACCDVDKRVVAVTGSAGTGKTQLLQEVYNRLTGAGYSVGMGAPTGKAAKRIREATGIDCAVTLHKLLEYSHPGEADPKTGKMMGFSFPKCRRDNPLEYDVVLIDEYAMVNQEVHRHLFDALKHGALVRVFGDVNQLKPIESNEEKADRPTAFMTLLEKFSGHVLKTIHRQGAGSGIIENGARILSGRIPIRRDDFTMSITNSPIEELRKYTVEMLANGVSFADIEHQVIVLGHRSWVGTVKVNAMMQNLFRTEAAEWRDIPRHPWHETAYLRLHIGDKILQTVNDYAIGAYNGEVGIVVELTEWDEVVVDFGDRQVVYPPLVEVTLVDGRIKQLDPRKNIDLAYAITTHKMQGSECQHIVYLMNKSNKYMQSRNNFYTGSTRARVLTHVISDMVSLSNSVTKR